MENVVHVHLHNDCNVFDALSKHCIFNADDIWIILYYDPSSVKLKNVDAAHSLSDVLSQCTSWNISES